MKPKAKLTGQAGEYLVCSEISALYYDCIPVNETCTYDIILDYGKLAKIQVKTSNYSPDANKERIKFSTSRRNSSNKLYKKRDTDIFALVWLDGKKVAWFAFEDCNGWKKTIKKEEFDKYTLEGVITKITKLDKARKK